jgi:hypothetical protein
VRVRVCPVVSEFEREPVHVGESECDHVGVCVALETRVTALSWIAILLVTGEIKFGVEITPPGKCRVQRCTAGSGEEGRLSSSLS